MHKNLVLQLRAPTNKRMQVIRGQWTAGHFWGKFSNVSQCVSRLEQALLTAALPPTFSIPGRIRTLLGKNIQPF